MVTRVDKKPIIYTTTMVRAWRPIGQMENKKLMREILEKSVGFKIPKLSPGNLFDDIEDISRGFARFGEDPTIFDTWKDWYDDADDEAIRIARLMAPKEMGRRAAIKSNNLAEATVKIMKKIVPNVSQIYYGTEAVYQLYTLAIHDDIFEHGNDPHYWEWAQRTASQVVTMQAPYLFIHPSGVEKMSIETNEDMPRVVMNAWCMFKKLETIALRIGSRKNLFAHAYHSGVSRKAFEPSKEIEDDFEIPLTGFARCKAHVRLYNLAGLRYFIVGNKMLIFNHDDSINLSTMSQCYFRVALYFSRTNGYPPNTATRALGLIKDIAIHACSLMDSSKNFSYIIRSMHILAQKDFNDVFEEEMGTNLGWEERSANYVRESRELDKMGVKFHERAKSLAIDKIDELNVAFIYHAFIGDEMLITDLRNKVKGMTAKVLDADTTEWATFIRFCKSYMISRYMFTHGRKPKVGGDLTQMNEKWAERCCNKVFTMPPQSDWGKVWISGEFAWSTFANSWHLEAQDVSYVHKDSDGLLRGKYMGDRMAACELLMAMTCGDVLDTLTGSRPTTARERICAGEAISEVVLTTAPKAENAKPSFKKRVTFAGDCEFRKMQAEYDRNCRKVMSFVRGPSLGVDQGALEKQFQDICNSTSLGLAGAVCSHDISAWSESMDRKRKFEFEEILIAMMTKPDMINIKNDWAKIKGTVLKGGAREIVAIDNSSFQGFDGSTSTILHAMILIYCIDSARRKEVMTSKVKANMATLIDDCVALMKDLDDRDTANAFWAHLKATYRKLGFEVDDLKSIFSTIKAIYLSRRFLTGGEVPADFKVFIKSHISYEDPLRCSMDSVSDIFGANRGAADANGDPWFIYHTSVFNTLLEIAHANPTVTEIPPSAASVFCLAPVFENGWGFPSIIDWGTNDITDKRSHFNAIMEALAKHSLASATFKAGCDPFTKLVGKAMGAIKSQPWRLVSYANIFTNPFDAIREGPLKPDMLRRNAVSDLLATVATAEPWVTLLRWSNSDTTKKIRELLVNSGPLHAPTLSALVNCMPDNYRLALVGKAVGSSSVLDLLPMGERALLKRRVNRCAQNFFRYSAATYSSSNLILTAEDVACISFKDQTIVEREEFYAANGVIMTDHTFPDPVGTFTHAAKTTGSVISPNMKQLRFWDRSKVLVNKVSQLICSKGIYVPRRSGRVWEITSEYAKGWDTVSQRIAMGLAILARTRADGHGTEGLQEYFIKAWNEMSNITPEDTHLISIHGSIKRLDSNPGSATHPIIFCRNVLLGFNNILTTATNAIPVKAKEISGSSSHLHDILAHETCMLATTALHYAAYQCLGIASTDLAFPIATRPDCVIAEDSRRMNTTSVCNRITLEILDSHLPYGLLQSCPGLASCIAIPTMKSSWTKMINNLMDGNHAVCEELIKEASRAPLDDLLHRLANDHVDYSAFVVLADAPARRGALTVSADMKFAVRPIDEEAKMKGDSYTVGVKTIPSKYNRAISAAQPEHVSCAVAIKSIVWERMKEHPADLLAKILYEDPDADYSIVSRCAKADFWRGVVAEASKHRRKFVLSELVMSGFRSLGIAGMHISITKDPAAVTQSVASYFGSHIKDVIKIVGPEVLSIAGRHAKNFDCPIMQRYVTNNPAVANARMRRDHMNKLIEFNMRALSERIKAIEDGDPKHRGDKRACEINMHSRLVELRCRRYVYKHAKVTECGSAKIDEEALGVTIRNCAESVCKRVDCDVADLPETPKTFEEVLTFTTSVGGYFMAMLTSQKSGWDAPAGNLGARLAFDTIMADSGHVAATRFAVSASELAPRVHRRMIVSQAGEPVSSDNDDFFSAHTSSADDFTMALGNSEGDKVSIEQLSAMNFTYGISLFIPAWQALYTLAFAGTYPVGELNEAMGTEMVAPVTFSQLREARLDEFTDDEVKKAFPNIAADYIACGATFNPQWLDRDEADAYMVDEMAPTRSGALF